MSEHALEIATTDYANKLRAFINKFHLPNVWFDEPDHIAFKARDSYGYERLLKGFVPMSESVSYVEMDGRRLAAAKLTAPLAIGTFSSVSWVEIMEPRPEKVGKGFVGLEHMEFWHADFDKVRNNLDDARIPYTLQSNPGHAWINIVLNEAGQELKINDRPLEFIVAEEIRNGEAHVIL